MKTEILVVGKNTTGEQVQSLKVLYNGQVIAEKVLDKNDRGRIIDIALKALRDRERALEAAFHFSNFEELTLLPAMREEMDETSKELEVVRRAIRELRELGGD